MLSLFRKRLPNNNLISKEFLKNILSCNSIIQKDFNLVINRRGKINMIFIGNPWMIEDYFNNDSVKSNPSQKRLIFISNKKNGFEKKDKVALINSKFNNFLMVNNLRKLSYEVIYKEKSSNKQLWSTENYDDINKLNESPLWQNFNKIKRNKIKLVDNNYDSERVYLVNISDKDSYDLENSKIELNELCNSLGKIVVGNKHQIRKELDSRTLIGKGLLNDVLLESKFHNANKIIFNKELLPHQSKKISSMTNIKISDRTELILEIFEKNAKSKEAHTQIELARLKYELPRLAGSGKSYSQIAGGIRSKGPGEKKIEQRRRYLRKRINELEKQIDNLSKRRSLTRIQRERNQLISATLVGYTCAGKSTLFNKLTKSKVVESTKAFSTLNPTTRRTYISQETQILLSDTVGFISDLPKDLISSFRATLEEIGQSDVLIHVIDASDPNYEEKIMAVENTLEIVGLENYKKIILFNKFDLIKGNKKDILKKMFPKQCISSITNEGINDFKVFLDKEISSLNSSENKLVANHL